MSNNEIVDNWFSEHFTMWSFKNNSIQVTYDQLEDLKSQLSKKPNSNILDDLDNKLSNLESELDEAREFITKINK